VAGSSRNGALPADIRVIMSQWLLFTKLPAVSCPRKTRLFHQHLQLPPGATQERTLEVLSQVEQYYSGKKKSNT